jgi:phosphoenolpyruvate phosphomutase
MLNSGDHASKTQQLREMLLSDEVAFIMEAHDGISSKIVEEAGFKGIWASGLSMSAALGVRDSNEASWTQVLDVLEFMADATTIPILVDGDTGYGNFNNMRRAVQKLCQRNIAGICIEDKLFPKTNSFIGDGQPLADIDEFCGKIKAGKDSQLDDDFSVISRVEALISGWGMAEALKRANAYHEAGADGILIHSKMRDGEEILEFLREWDRRCPVVIVPTTYYQTPTEAFKEAGASLVIWANHNIRAGISAMREVSRRIHRDQSLIGVEDKIASVGDIFELAENAELAEAEKIYLPASEPEVNAVILAASRGSKLGDLTNDIPKCMIDIQGQPLLRRLTTTLNRGRVRKITVVRGYKKETVNLPSLDFVDNDNYDETGEAVSLNQARDALTGPTIFAYGDILFRQHILEDLLDADGDIVLVADALWREKDPDPVSRTRDLMSCSEPFNTGYLGNDNVVLSKIGADIGEKEIHAEWIGLAKISAAGAAAITAELDKIDSEGALATSSMIDVFQRLCAGGTEIRVHYVTGHWLDVDNAVDLAEALKFL